MKAERFFTVTWPSDSGERYRAFSLGIATKKRKVAAIRALVTEALANGEPATSRGLSVLSNDAAALTHANAWGWSGKDLELDQETGEWSVAGGFQRVAEHLVVV